MDTNNSDANITAPEKMQSPCHFMKLFDGYDPHGTLWKVRNKIYSYVWSRNRRDRAKFDWVLSQYGVNRNVPERLIQGTPYQTAAFKSIEKLRCWLMLANKKISADFTAYIYSANFLEIDVDLKAMHTADNEANLRRIITLLQNQNFVRYTQSVLVRIHFPDKYPFQDLPTFNFQALEDIATTLDTFNNMEYMDVRIVPMQDPRDYELRFAALPFYHMGFTDWSMHILNDTMSYWDMVDGAQIHHLNKSWSLYRTSGSLTEPVDLGTTGDKSVTEDHVSDTGLASHTKDHPSARKQNGSQKRRHRKMRTTVSAAIDTGSAVTTSSVAASSRPNTPVSTFQPELPEVSTTSRSVEVHLEHLDKSLEKRPASELTFASANGPPQTPSPSLLPNKQSGPSSSADTSTTTTSGDIVLTPDHSSAASPGSDIFLMAQLATKVENMAEPNESMDTQTSRTPRPLSPAPSSATLGRSQEEDETLSAAGKVLNEAASSANRRDCESTAQKKKRRRNRRKPKKPKDASTATQMVEGVEKQPVAASILADENEVDVNQDQDVSCDDISTLFNGHITFYNFGKPDIPVSGLTDLQPCGENFCVGMREDGVKQLVSRTQHTERLLRQQQRMTANQVEKEAEKSKARGKRQSKKAKEALLRRRKPSHNLRCQAENTKHPRIGKRSSGLKDKLKISNKGNDGFQTDDYKSDVSSEMPGSDMDTKSCVGRYGGSDNDDDDDDDESRVLFQGPSPHERCQTPDVDDADMTIPRLDSYMLTSANDQSQHVPDERVELGDGSTAQFIDDPLTDEDGH